MQVSATALQGTWFTRSRERIPGTAKQLYQFTAIDDCTRIRVLKVYDACNQRTPIQLLNEVRRRLPFRIQVIQTDNAAGFQSQFHWHAESLNIRHVYVPPRTTHLNGKVERSHRVDDQAFYQLTKALHEGKFEEKLKTFTVPRLLNIDEIGYCPSTRPAPTCSSSSSAGAMRKGR